MHKKQSCVIGLIGSLEGDWWCLASFDPEKQGEPHWVEMWFPSLHWIGMPEQEPPNSGAKQDPDVWPEDPPPRPPLKRVTLQLPFD